MAKKSKSGINQTHVLIIGFSALVFAGAIIVSSVRNSQARPGFDPNTEVSQKECDRTGAPVVNVTQRVVNTVDSGEGGNYWAFDDLNRTIQVWRESPDTYCALVDYKGKFDSQAGQKSPGNTGILTGKEDGTFKGGYRATIKGVLKENPAKPAKGHLGTTDYKCDLSGNCPGAFNWVDVYFGPSATGPLFSYEWWGWEYTYQNKTWVNSSDGNTGDLL